MLDANQYETADQLKRRALPCNNNNKPATRSPISSPCIAMSRTCLNR